MESAPEGPASWLSVVAPAVHRLHNPGVCDRGATHSRCCGGHGGGYLGDWPDGGMVGEVASLVPRRWGLGFMCGHVMLLTHRCLLYRLLDEFDDQTATDNRGSIYTVLYVLNREDYPTTFCGVVLHIEMTMSHSVFFIPEPPFPKLHSRTSNPEPSFPNLHSRTFIPEPAFPNLHSDRL